MRIIVIDTETTGLGPDDRVVEFASVTLMEPADKHDTDGGISVGVSSRVNPGRSIPAEASAIHHLIDKDVALAPPLSTLLDKVFRWQPTDVLAAHNASFDLTMLAQSAPSTALPERHICTYRCATKLWPDAPGHGNQVLRYWLPGMAEEVFGGGEWDGSHPMQLPPHRALPDAWVTAHILRRMLTTHTVDQLVQITTEPLLLGTVRFGKHRGINWAEVPKDYLRWIVGKPQEWDRDTLHTARHYLEAPL